MGFLKPKVNVPKQEIVPPTPPVEEAGVIEDEADREKKKNKGKGQLKTSVQESTTTGVNTGSTGVM